MKFLLFIIAYLVWAEARAGENASATNTTPAEFKSILAKAKTGDAYAEFQLGRCYYEGLGVKENRKKAVKRLEKAGEQGIPEAQMLAGVAYWTGLDVKMNDVKGVKWFEKAADLGEPGAFFYLGASYYLGKGFKQDFMQSYKWTLLFKESGHSVITNNKEDVDAKIAELEGKLTSTQILEAKLLEKDLKARLSMFARFSEDDGNKQSSHLPEFGYSYPVAAGDTLEAIVLAYKSQGVDVTVGQIVAANPGLKLSTKLVAGMKLFIPDKNAKPDNGAKPIQTR